VSRTNEYVSFSYILAASRSEHLKKNAVQFLSLRFCISIWCKGVGTLIWKKSCWALSCVHSSWEEW